MAQKATTCLTMLCACLGLLAACGPTVPRSYADPGVPQRTAPGAQNAPYYTGADPAYPRGYRGGGGGGT